MRRLSSMALRSTRRLRTCALGLLLLTGALACDSGADHGAPRGSDGGANAGAGDPSMAGGPVVPGGPMDQATETNVAPIRCERDGDCANGGECVRPSPDEPSGTCMRAVTAGGGADEDAGLGR